MPASQAGRRRFESGRPLQIAARNGSPLRAIFSLPEVLMARRLIALLAPALLAWFPPPVEAQSVGHVFRRVNPSVVVIRTKEKDVAALGQGQGQMVSVTGVGSRVLISPDGEGMPAAQAVHPADEIGVEFLSGEAVGARVVASEPQADVSLLQLERVPPGALAAELGDSGKGEGGGQG